MMFFQNIILLWFHGLISIGGTIGGFMRNSVTIGKKSFFEISVKDAAIHWLGDQLNQYTVDRRLA